MDEISVIRAAEKLADLLMLESIERDSLWKAERENKLCSDPKCVLCTDIRKQVGGGK